MTIWAPLRRTPEEWAAHDALGRAATDARRLGLRLPCIGPDSLLWISMLPEEREAAAELCTGCPVIEPCRRAGRSETAGVWGGVDQTNTPRSERR